MFTPLYQPDDLRNRTGLPSVLLRVIADYWDKECVLCSRTILLDLSNQPIALLIHKDGDLVIQDRRYVTRWFHPAKDEKELKPYRTFHQENILWASLLIHVERFRLETWSYYVLPSVRRMRAYDSKGAQIMDLCYNEDFPLGTIIVREYGQKVPIFWYAAKGVLEGGFRAYITSFSTEREIKSPKYIIDHETVSVAVNSTTIYACTLTKLTIIDQKDPKTQYSYSLPSRKPIRGPKNEVVEPKLHLTSRHLYITWELSHKDLYLEIRSLEGGAVTSFQLDGQLLLVDDDRFFIWNRALIEYRIRTLI
jgi:hypothetical protein